MSRDPSGGLTGWFFGYDPGGNDKHGVAALPVRSGVAESPLVSMRQTVGDVLSWFGDEGAAARAERLVAPVLGIGIDTLTYWSSNRSGTREADRFLMDEFPGKVIVQNSLASSMTVNGMFVLRQLRGCGSGQVLAREVFVTETHPKILCRQLGWDYEYDEKKGEMNVFLAAEMGLTGHDCGALTANPHEWDAVISAWAAFQGMSGAWSSDLVDLDRRAELKGNVQLDFPSGEVHYCWPAKVG